MASIAPVLGIEYIRSENKKSPTKMCLAISSFAIMLWCFGYGMMGFQTDFTRAYIWRGIALFGVYFYLSVEIYFVLLITKFTNKVNMAISWILTGFCLVTFLAVIQPNVVDFYDYNGRLVYDGNPCIARVIQGVCTLCVFVFLLSRAILYFIKCKYRRDRSVVIILFFSHIAMFTLLVNLVMISTKYISTLR